MSGHVNFAEQFSMPGVRSKGYAPLYMKLCRSRFWLSEHATAVLSFSPTYGMDCKPSELGWPHCIAQVSLRHIAELARHLGLRNLWQHVEHQTHRVLLCSRARRKCWVLGPDLQFPFPERVLQAGPSSHNAPAPLATWPVYGNRGI